MKLKVWEEHEELPPPVQLRLVQEGHDVTVVAVKPDGTTAAGGRLLCFKKEGHVQLIAAIGEELGFVLTVGGRMSVE